MDTNGFHGDTFSSRFGNFYTARKRMPQLESSAWSETPFSGPNEFYKQEPSHISYPHHKFKVTFLPFSFRWLGFEIVLIWYEIHKNNPKILLRGDLIWTTEDFTVTPFQVDLVTSTLLSEQTLKPPPRVTECSREIC